MSELRRGHNGDLIHYSMESISVDGIFGTSYQNFHGGYFFSLKSDLRPWEEEWKQDYLDDTQGRVPWNGAWIIFPEAHPKYGEIDEELWLQNGSIVGKNHPRFDELRNLG